MERENIGILVVLIIMAIIALFFRFSIEKECEKKGGVLIGEQWDCVKKESILNKE
jgi:hypothetical protein